MIFTVQRFLRNNVKLSKTIEIISSSLSNFHKINSGLINVIVSMGRTNSVVLLVFGPVLCNIFFRCHIFQFHFSSNCFAKNVVDTFCTIFKTFAFRSNLFLIDKNFRLDILLFCDNNGI